MLQKLGTHPLRVRIGLVDLVDRHDERHAGRLRVADRLHRLGHDTVISRHHEHDDIRHLGATGRMEVNAAWPGVSMKVTMSPDGDAT